MFWIVGSILSLLATIVFPKGTAFLNFVIPLNSTLTTDMQLFDFSDFLGVFIQSHSGCKFERSSQSTHTHSASKFVN